MPDKPSTGGGQGRFDLIVSDSAPLAPMRQMGRGAASDPGTAAKEFLRTLLRRRWVVFAMFLAVSITGTFVTLRMTPMYESVGKIAVFREAQDPLGFQQSAVSDSTEDWDYSVALETQVRIIESDLIASMVIQNLGLAHNPNFNPKSDKVARPPSGTHAEITPEILQLFDEALAVEPVRNTRIIELRVRTKDPKLSADIVNNLLTVYQERNFRDRFESSMQASEWMSKQTADLKLKTEMAQEALVQYQKENEILGVDEKQNITTVKLDELNKELTKAETERMQKQASFEQLRAGQYDQIPSLSQNQLIQKLIEKRSELQRALADASVQLGPEFPRVKQLKQQLTESERSLEAEMKSIASRLQTEYKEAQRREQLVRASLEDQKRQANLLNEKAIQYNILKREAESNRQLYEGVMQKMKEASISAGLRSNNIRVVDVGRVPSKPVSPKVARLILLAMLLGLISGVAMAFIFEILDNTVRTPEELENDLNLTSLGIIPLHNEQNALPGKEKTSLGMVARNEIALTSHSQPKSQVAEAYRALRTSLLLSSAGAPPQIIAISSALPQEGKTTTCANLAIVMAQKGGRILVVDADMRRPSVGQRFGIRSRIGLSNVLAGNASAEEAIFQVSDIPNLWVMPAGPNTPHPAEMLESKVMENLLAKLRREFDYIIVDTPPVLSVTDAVVVSVFADAFVLVSRSGKTTRQAMRRSRDLLWQVNAKLMGIVINAVDMNAADKYYYNYYYGADYNRRYYGDASSEVDTAGVKEEHSTSAPSKN